MLGSLKRIWAWFLGGLVEACMLVDGRQRRRIALVRDGNDYAVGQPGKSSRGLLHIEDGDGGPVFRPNDLAASLRDRDIDIVLAADEVLVRTLDPLPGESRQFLDSIVQHQLERVAPWRVDDVLHTYRVTPAERGNDRLLVTVIATARSLQARVLEAVNALSPREVRLLCQDAALGPDTIAIPVDRGAGEAARHAKLRHRVVVALAALLLLTAGGFSALGWALYRTGNDLDEVAQSVTQMRHKLVAARGPIVVGDQDLKAMLERRAVTPFAVLALDALASALPDDTFLTELRLSDGKLRMTGISRNVAGVVPRIEASRAFADATFFAPTTRLPGNEGDRFHIEAKLLPMHGPKS